MSVQLHIERLVLEGLPVSQHQSVLVHAAVEQELARLLRDGRLTSQITVGGAVPSLQGGTIQGGDSTSPMRLGVHIAGAVHSAIGDGK